jgi:hypothetical protein
VPELRDGTKVVYAASQDSSFALDAASGKPILALKRERRDGATQESLVAEVDGRLRHLMRNPTAITTNGSLSDCWSAKTTTNGSAWAVRMVADNTARESDGSGVHGFVGWNNAGAVRAANYPWHPDLGYGAHMIYGDWLTYYAVGGVITAESLSTGEQVSMISPATQPDGKPHILIPAGRTMFFEVGDGGVATIYSWTPEAGLRTFLRTAADGRPADRDRGDGMIATDGRDIVWSHVEEMDPDPERLYLYGKRDLMTAPFTPDRAQLRARRLRSDPALGLGPAKATAVGCGYYATSGASAAAEGEAQTSDLFVVRIADGRAWWIRGNAGTHCDRDDCDSFVWGNVLGISCEPGRNPEIFAKGSVLNDLSTVLRVPIDLTKLGPGIPAD